MMNFNPYSNGYQPNYAQPQYNYAQNQNNNSVIWVQGIESAKSYMVAPNTTVQLWDSERPCIYLKSADATGMPSMKILDYTIRENEQPQAPIKEEKVVDYVTKDEFNAFREEIKSQLNKSYRKEVKRNEQSSKSNSNG
jgi:hypothetical protein